MYAVIRTGGKQHKVQPATSSRSRSSSHDDETVTFTPLLVVDDDGKTHAGTEAAKAVVTAKPLGEKKGDKVKVFKYRPKTGYAKRGRASPAAHAARDPEIKLGDRRRRQRRAPGEPPESPRPRERSRRAEPGSRGLGALVAWRPMAHKKGGGSSRNGRDSNAKRLGVKAFGGQT